MEAKLAEMLHEELPVRNDLTTKEELDAEMYLLALAAERAAARKTFLRAVAILLG